MNSKSWELPSSHVMLQGWGGDLGRRDVPGAPAILEADHPHLSCQAETAANGICKVLASTGGTGGSMETTRS